MNVKGHAEERFVEKNVGRETLNRDFTSITKNTENINSISNVTGRNPFKLTLNSSMVRLKTVVYTG